MKHIETSSLDPQSSEKNIVIQDAVEQLSILKETIGYDKIPLEKNEIQSYSLLFDTLNNKLSTIVKKYKEDLLDPNGKQLWTLWWESEFTTQWFKISQLTNSIQIEWLILEETMWIEIEKTSEWKVILLTQTKKWHNTSANITTSIQVYLQWKQEPQNYIRGRKYTGPIVDLNQVDLNKDDTILLITEYLALRKPILNTL